MTLRRTNAATTLNLIKRDLSCSQQENLSSRRSFTQINTTSDPLLPVTLPWLPFSANHKAADSGGRFLPVSAFCSTADVEQLLILFDLRETSPVLLRLGPLFKLGNTVDEFLSAGQRVDPLIL